MRALLALLLLILAGAAHGAAIERLVMPGELIRGHAKYEEQCDSCHQKFAERGQNTLCRECHDRVDADIKGARGFHGRMQNARSVACASCHADHKGRDAKIVPLDKETFPHARTDFPLKGAHARVACASCHDSGKKWRDAPTDCLSCHKKNDPHEGRLGKACADCHDTGSWKKAQFDHDKTKFRLDGAHAKTLCAACHPGERYKETPKDCASCHRIDDAHAGRYGAKCADCHTATKWKQPRFDHEKTKFPLRDRHREVACDACHTGDLYKEKAPLTCNGCHKEDDAHRGKNGPKCESCHDQRGWTKARFEHNRKTRFPLAGAHQRLECESCHKGEIYKVKLDATCHSCHRGDDRHRGQLGEECQTCHNQKSWGEKVRFDHDLTRFPLIGLHAAAPCEACHLSAARYHDTPTACAQCHADDDKHKKTLGQECGTCHTPNDWALWKFDHDRQTRHKLSGKHAGLDCAACHRAPMDKEVRQSAACAACHRQDDLHVGRFGDQCDRCHTTQSFKDVEIRQ